MPRLAVTVQQIIARYPTLPPAANSADFVWTAGGANFADGFSFALTGQEVLLVMAPVGGGTVTLNSVIDPYKRTGDITAYSLGASELAVFYPPVEGFRQTNGMLHGAVSSATVSIAVLRLS